MRTRKALVSGGTGYATRKSFDDRHIFSDVTSPIFPPHTKPITQAVVSVDPSPVLEAPAATHHPETLEAGSVLKKRLRKMNRHKYKKWRKKMRSVRKK